jgi:hypothetical protein
VRKIKSISINDAKSFGSGDSGQQQNQSTGFNTGKWSKPPELFRNKENLVLRLESKVAFSLSVFTGIKSKR